MLKFEIYDFIVAPQQRFYMETTFQNVVVERQTGYKPNS